MIASLMKTWWDTANGGKCNDLLCTSHLVSVTRKGISSCMKMHHVLTYIANDSSCDFKGKKKTRFEIICCCNAAMSELQASLPGPLPYKESPTIGQPDCVVKRRHIPQPKEPLNSICCKVFVPTGLKMQTTQSQVYAIITIMIIYVSYIHRYY